MKDFVNTQFLDLQKVAETMTKAKIFFDIHTFSLFLNVKISR